MVFLEVTSRSLSSANLRTFGSALRVEEKSSSNDIFPTKEDLHAIEREFRYLCQNQKKKKKDEMLKVYEVLWLEASKDGGRVQSFWWVTGGYPSYFWLVCCDRSANSQNKKPLKRQKFFSREIRDFKFDWIFPRFSSVIVPKTQIIFVRKRKGLWELSLRTKGTGDKERKRK